MTAVAQIALPIAPSLPLEPSTLVDLEPIDRGRLYNGLDLDFSQRQAVEEALRMVDADIYPTRAGEVAADAAAHLVRERERREAMQRPPRDGGRA